ncbi:hypothetical protein M422DRAFT_264651 [Sphaerobolus stellatus SS14]|uniref:Retrotransposon gag domain-containing protein n=1 Tax=Sphaerobolus stellatus (strain SS14) TaxID=990650 RepID=A0A0C9UF78_SPHS4|nr:hypothetical protein M422DRAFT_264651 [Sphaerobolus stellatus SS14]
MSTQTQTVTHVSSSLQPKSNPGFLTAQDQRADCQRHTQSRGLIDSQGHPLGSLPPPTRPCRQMAGTTDTSGLPGPPPGDNPRENNDSNHGNQSPHPSRNNSPRGSTGEGGDGPLDDGDDGDGGPPPDPPPDGNDPINFVDDVRCELRSLLSGGRESSSKVRAPDPFDGPVTELCIGLEESQVHPNLLKGTALEFFEPYIPAEDDPDYVEPTFFTDWIAFKQILFDNFGSTFLEEEAEMALEKLAFPDGGRATKYFIQFTKYKARTNFVMKISDTSFFNSTPITGNTMSNNSLGNTGRSSGSNKTTSDKGKTKQKSLVAAECCFSSSGLTGTNRRNQLLPQTFEALQLLKNVFQVGDVIDALAAELEEYGIVETNLIDNDVFNV